MGVFMKVQAQITGLNFTEKTQRAEIALSSKSASGSNKYAAENHIEKLEHRNIIDVYFKIFDGSHTEVEIKNMIAARLQPAYQLPQVHDTKALSLKAKELLNFSFTI